MQWTTQAEYWLTPASATPGEVLQQFTMYLQHLSLSELAQQRIQRLLLEAIQRRPPSVPLLLRLLTADLKPQTTAQSCSFFLLEKKGCCETGKAEEHTAIELYLFQ